MSLPIFAQLSIGITIENSVRYVLFAGVAWLLAYVLRIVLSFFGKTADADRLRTAVD